MTQYALCKDVTPTRATVVVLADTAVDLALTSDELASMGLDDTAEVFAVADDVEVGQRIWR